MRENILILNEPFTFDEGRNFVFVGDKVIVDLDPNGVHDFKEATVKSIRVNMVAVGEVKTKYGWTKPKWKVPYQSSLAHVITPIA